jgi:hypothetical protein
MHPSHPSLTVARLIEIEEARSNENTFDRRILALSLN